MVTCKFCSLKFNTDQELNAHIKICGKNIQSPLLESSSSETHICEFCQISFMTAEELGAHVNSCEIKQYRTTVASNLETMKNVVENVLSKRFEQKTLGQCHSCLRQLYNVQDVVEHRKTCKVIQMGNIIEEMYSSYKAIISGKRSTRIPISPPSPEPSTSKESKEKKSSRKRVLDTSTERECATESESSPETSPPPSKMFRSSDKDIMDIETKETFKCVICSLKFESLDALQTHILQCPKKYGN